MPHSITHRAGVDATLIALALTFALAAGASAQVATLVGPDETPTPGSDSAPTEPEFADRDEALLAFAQCMRDNGIDMDDPDVSAGGRGFFRGGPDGSAAGIDLQSEEFLTAQQACGSILETARPDLDPAAEAERVQEDLALAQCLRDNGHPDYPDPVISPGGSRQRFGGQHIADLGIDPRSEEFQSARSTCADELGIEQFGPGAGPGPQGGD